MSKIRVSAVSYTNTKPFIYGLEHSEVFEQIDLSLDNPSDCARKLIDDEADIGLIPVAALCKIPNYRIISEFCIGARTSVNSVFIFSRKPITEIKTIRFDSQSRTSNALAKILLTHHWKTDPDYSNSMEADCFVEIGDRTFGKKDKYPFSYDLAQAWNEFTGLPFVFAVWSSNKIIEPEFISRFNSALKLGIENIHQIVKQINPIPNFDIKDYLTNKLDYHFDSEKLKALELFLSYPENKNTDY